MSDQSFKGKWALILGASSGMGAAVSRELAKAGMNIFGVHLDMKTTLPLVKTLIEDIEGYGSQAMFFNVNAADETKRGRVLDKVQETLAAAGAESTVHVMMHSLAFGTLLPFVHEDPAQRISKAQMDMTLDVMAHSLVYWTQDLMDRHLLGRGSRIFAMTSEGSHRVVTNYGAVSAAKAALESHTRVLAQELGKQGILVNCIQAGVTDTPALRKIPGNEKIVEGALRRNPVGRLTTTQDVAITIRQLSHPDIRWVSGSIIFVDGGEDACAG
ncbi:MAG: SDR family oxidoreductase [Anaerolineae bacterium]|jgi:NAD(P)-dependent dehydrogenase (short-subunit alcohol dehydrogenase family)|uniref:SDR family oxidoreductase n=1 Tax=Candidatus Amarolinea dominans TaxID=3140696 RepID=UPI001D2359FD|nr:SDR family oxidoreductase [Anaerolineae bacterium]MBK7203961.1 SDR family oxidoreductase [Anaerolineae bacterium]MBK9092229.1 SDR family oxidoreductase [Anaerolineae bacterium]MBK9229478.1 SDR family oxidoreductase [Anaerolineae bacterium]